MSDRRIYDTPSKVTARDGVVTVAGPDHVDFLMTPDAAVETSDRLLHGAMKALGQQHFDPLPQKPRRHPADAADHVPTELQRDDPA